MTVTLTIDGQEVTVPEGSTILDAAKELDIEIPTLCYIEELEPACSCFICVVEVEGRGNLRPSCGEPATEGMVVHTKSEAVQQARRMCLELLLSEHRGDCIAPCSLACPANLDIPGFIVHLLDDEPRKALELIKERIPLPGALGRICARYCERVCRRQESEDSIAICVLKRYPADVELESGEVWAPEPEESTGQSVAIIGAGPTGLSAAYYLLRSGHAVTIIDDHDEPGGMFRYGIPEFRLPKKALDHEIETIRRMGAEFRMATRVGRDVSIEDLTENHDAVLVACGATAQGAVQFEGAEHCLPVMPFLAKGADGTPPELGERVIVLGGGYEAVDAARIAVRQGKQVTIVCEDKKARMSAFEELVDAALEEGVQLVSEAQVTSVEQAGGALRVTCVCDEDERTLEADTVIAAPQRVVDEDGLKAMGLKVGRRGLDVDRGSYRASMARVFGGGDVSTGPGTGVRSVAAGRQSAECIMQFLSGEDPEREGRPYNVPMRALTDEDREVLLRHIDPRSRTATDLRPAEDRADDFQEVQPGFDEAEALAECDRCLQCDCLARYDCKLRAYGEGYEASTNRYSATPGPLARDASTGEVVFEPHKCILCGVCVRLAESRGERLGIGFQQRGYTTRVAVPFDAQLADGLESTYRLCAESCPTGALAICKRLPEERKT